MSDTKHTKGPWKIVGYSGQHDESGAMITCPIGKLVCSTNSVRTNSPLDWEEYYANAKLIAAAPELLEQLIILKNKLFLINDDISGNHYCSFDDEINAANEVIKKTTV